RQTGQGLALSTSVSRTTQFACQFIVLIARRCPALASSTWFAYSAENQHIRPSSNFEKLTDHRVLGKKWPPSCFGISGVCPQAGERISRVFGGSDAYFVALEV